MPIEVGDIVKQPRFAQHYEVTRKDSDGRVTIRFKREGGRTLDGTFRQHLFEIVKRGKITNKMRIEERRKKLQSNRG